MAQTMIVFGFTMLMLNIFCLIFGESAKGYSALYELGNDGVPVKIALQFLCVSVLSVLFRFIFFTDMIIKTMAIWLRTICLLTAMITTIGCFATAFGWFPANTWQAWAMFLICFGISFLGSFLVMLLKEKLENKRMNEALRKIKKSQEKQV